MTYPFAAYTHVHVSEREEAHQWPDGRWDLTAWEDCLFASGLELIRFAGIDAPATLVEAEAIRADAGVPPSGPSQLGELIDGLFKRYGISIRRAYGQDALINLLPGQAAVIAGSLGHFVAGHHLRRWDKDYIKGHAVIVYRFVGSWWWCDPLAPKGTYTGESVTDTEVLRFMYDGSLFTFATQDEFKKVEEPVLDFDLISRVNSGVTVNGAGHALIRLRDRAYVPVIAGYFRNAFAKVRLALPLDTRTGDRQTGYLVTHAGSAHFVLGVDVIKDAEPILFTEEQMKAAVEGLFTEDDLKAAISGLWTSAQVNAEVNAVKTGYEAEEKGIATELDDIARRLRL